MPNQVEIKITADVKAAIAGITGVAAAAQKLKSDLESDGSGKGLTGVFDGLEGAAKKVGVALAGIGSAGSAIGAIGGIAASAKEASGALLLMPAAFSAVRIGMGVFNMAAGDFMTAMHNLGDTKKFNKAMEAMGETAKPLAGYIKSAYNILSEDLDVKMFDGLAAKAQPLIFGTLPELKKAFDGIAGSANTAAKSFMDMLSKSNRQADIKQIIGDSSKIWDELLKAVTPLSEAFIDIAAVGAPMLAGLAAGAGDLAQKFADFIHNARETQQLKGWISDGLNALGELGKIAGNVAGSIKAIWTGLSSGTGPGGGLEAVTAATEKFQQLMESPAVQDGLKALGEMFKTVSQEAGKVFAELMTQLGPIFKELAPVVAEVAKTLGGALVAALQIVGPWLQKVAGFMREHKDAIAEAAPWIAGAVVAIKLLAKAYKAFKLGKGLLDGLKKLKEQLLLTGAREALDGVGLGIDALKRGLDGAATAAGLTQLAIAALKLLFDTLDLGVKSVGVSFDFGAALDEAIDVLTQNWDTRWAEFDQKVVDSLAALKQKWTDFWTTGLGEAMTTALTALQAAWDTFWQTALAASLTTALTALQTQWATFWETGLTEQMNTSLTALQAAWDTFWTTGLGESMAAALLALQTQWATFWETGLTETMNTALATLLDAWNTFWTTGLVEALTTNSAVLLEAWTLFWTTSLAEPMATALLALQTQWATFWTTGLVEALTTNSAVLLEAWTTFWSTALTEAMTTALTTLQTAWTTWWVTFIETQTTNLALLLEGWTTFWTTALLEPFTTATTALQEQWTLFWTTFLTTMTTNTTLLQEQWTLFWTTLTETMVNGITALSAGLTAGMAVIVEQWTAQWAAMGLTVTTQMVAMTAAVAAAMTEMTAAVTAGMTAQTAAVTAGMAAMLAAVTAGTAAMTAAWTAGWTAMQAATTAAVTAIQSAITTMMTAIQSAIETGLQTIISFWQTNWQAAYDLVKNLDWTGLGQAVVDGIRAGLEGGWPALEAFVKEKATALLTAAKAALGVASPSKKFRDEVGKQIPRGIAVGIQRNQKYAVRAVQQMNRRIVAAGVVAGFQAGDPRVLRGSSGGRGGSRGRGGGHGWDRHRWSGASRFPRDASVVAGFQMDDIRAQNAQHRGGGRHVTFGGDCDGAFATAFMKLHRTGRIQIR